MEIPRWIASRSVSSSRLRLFQVGYLFFTLFIVSAVLLTSGCKSKQQSSPPEGGAAAPAPPDSIELLFTYGSEKERWINEVTDKFNREDRRAQGGKRIFVRAIPMGSGECIDELLDGT